MRRVEYHPGSLEYLKNNDFPALENSNSVEDAVLPQSQSNVETKPEEKDSGNQEREQQMETWMSNIKTFIRSIDISKL
jgi:hypothetical protein